MTADHHSQLANFIWSICNLLRGPYKRNEYRKVILPLTVLRRFDCLLAPTKAQVLARHSKIKAKPETVVRSLKKFAAVDLSPEHVDNVQMGYVFEELIRIGAEQSNEEAGEHFTPREVIRLMVNLLLSPERDLRKSYVTCWRRCARPRTAEAASGSCSTVRHSSRAMPAVARATVDFLDRETARIDTLVTKIETAIERLQEHRTALITAAVTGKIDVRGTVVREEDAA